LLKCRNFLNPRNLFKVANLSFASCGGKSNIFMR
jgi:hypothetical protein